MTKDYINPENGIADDGRTTKPYLRASLASSGGAAVFSFCLPIICLDFCVLQ
jgi:hypothetical protein